MTDQEWAEAIQEWPKKVIGSNSKLRKTHFWQWSIPALSAAVVRNGKLTRMRSCPSAGDCAKLCYALQGGFNFDNTKIAHTRNLQAYFNDPTQLAMDIVEAIQSKRKIKAFRVHDSGDYFSAGYARWWFKIIKQLPEIQFYSYTKRVSLFKKTLKNEIPSNLTLIYSYGGVEDHLIDPETDRHSRVFKTYADMIKAGYSDTTNDDFNASQPELKNIGLVYHGVITLDKAFSDADMGQGILLD